MTTGAHLAMFTTLSLAVGATAFGAQAPATTGLVASASVSSAAALAAATAARDACGRLGFHVAVSVVDAGGNLLVTLRADGAAPHTAGASQRKAYTALTLRKSTQEFARLLSTHPDGAGLHQLDGFLIVGGGVPIQAGESTVGGIGVSGAPNDHGDEQCAAAGIAAVSASLKNGP